MAAPAPPTAPRAPSPVPRPASMARAAMALLETDPAFATSGGPGPLATRAAPALILRITASPASQTSMVPPACPARLAALVSALTASPEMAPATAPLRGLAPLVPPAPRASTPPQTALPA